MNYFDTLYTELHKSPEFSSEYLASAFTGIIRAYMKRQGVTQEELAERLGVTQANIAKKLGKGQNLTLKSISDIASALGAEWTGFELVSHEKARRKEQQTTWPREIRLKITQLDMQSEELSHDPNPADNDFCSCA